MGKNARTHKQTSRKGAEILRFADARKRHRPAPETGFSDQIAALALQLEAHGRDCGPHGRGGPVRVDRRWQRLTRRLKRLPQRRIWRRHIPRAANDRAPFWAAAFARQERARRHYGGASAQKPFPLRVGLTFVVTFLGLMMAAAAGALATGVAAFYVPFP